MWEAYSWSVLAGMLFAIWPFVMKATGLPPIVAAVFLTASSLLVYPPFLKGSMDIRALTILMVALAIVAGLINGVGTIALQKVIASKEIDVATGIFVIIMTQIVVTTIGGFFFAQGDLFTTKKLAGLWSASLAVYLLTSK